MQGRLQDRRIHPGELVVAGSQWWHLLREKQTVAARLVPVPTDLTLGARGGRIPTAASLRGTCPGSVKQHVRSLGKALAAGINVLLLSSASTGSKPHSAPLPKATEDGEDAEFDSD